MIILFFKKKISNNVAGEATRGAGVEVYEGSAEVLHYWQQRGSSAGEDDWSRTKQVQWNVCQVNTDLLLVDDLQIS